MRCWGTVAALAGSILSAAACTPHRLRPTGRDAGLADVLEVDAGAPDAGGDGGVSVDASVRETYARLPFQAADPGILVEVSFAGAPPVLMRYDTGSPTTYLDVEFAHGVGIADSGMVEAKIGDTTFPSRNVMLLDWFEADFVYTGLSGPIEGLIGNDFFHEFAVGVEHRGQLLWLTESPAETDLLDHPSDTGPPIIVPFTEPSGYLLLGCRFGAGSAGECLFDFGAVFGLTFERIWSTVPHPDPHQVPVFTIDNQGHDLRGYFQRGDLEAGDLRVSGRAIEVLSEFPLLDQVGAAIGHELSGLVGLDSTLGSFTVVDYVNRRLLFFPYDEPPERPNPFEGFGFVLGSTSDGGLLVRAVVPFSDAETKGVLEGDVIRAIDGAPLGTVPLTFTGASILEGSSGDVKTFRLQRGGVDVEVEVMAEDLLPPLP